MIVVFDEEDAVGIRGEVLDLHNVPVVERHGRANGNTHIVPGNVNGTIERCCKEAWHRVKEKTIVIVGSTPTSGSQKGLLEGISFLFNGGEKMGKLHFGCLPRKASGFFHVELLDLVPGSPNDGIQVASQTRGTAG